MEHFDVCIIGAGLTGLLSARKFLKEGKKVLLVERGSEYRPSMDDRETWWQECVTSDEMSKDGRILTRNTFPGSEEKFPDLVSCDTRNAPWNFQYNMWHGIGGSAQMWSGMSWRLAPHDFRLKEIFGHGEDWPVSYEELAPFYDEAETLMEVSGPSPDETSSYRFWPWKNNFRYKPFRLSYLDRCFQDSIGDIGQIVMQPHAVRNLPAEEGGCVGAKTCVSCCPTGAIFKARERLFDDIVMDDNLDLRVETCCVRLEWDTAAGKITKAVLREKDSKEEYAVSASLFFLCANALENITLIQRSEVMNNKRFGRSADMVGRYFSSHGAFTWSVLMEKPVYPTRGRPTHGSIIEWVERQAEDRRNGVLMEVWQSDFFRGYHPKEHFEKDVAAGHWGGTLFKRLSDFERRFAISLIFETDMSHTKAVTLSPDHVDHYGLPVPLVSLSLNDQDERTIRFGLGKVDEISACAGIDSLEPIGYGFNGNHPLGGLRMSDSPETGVVDRFGRSHDFQNLYILGGGMFCSTGSFNPTLTIAALTLRTLQDDPRLQDSDAEGSNG